MNNKIPENWKKYTIGEIGEVIGGGTPSTKVDEYYNGDIAWITPKDLSGYNSVFIKKGSRSITKKGLINSSAKLMPKGTVLFTSRAPIGYVAIAENEVSTNQGFKSIICNEKAYNKFIYYWLKLNKDKIESSASGSTFKEISGGVLKSIEIFLPPFTEQKKIADFLFELDSKIEINQKINSNLEKIGNAIFKKWFIDFEFPNENGKTYKSSGGEMVYSEKLGKEIPKDWEVKPIDEIADFLNGLAMQKYPSQSENEYLPVIKIRELKQGITDSTDKANVDIPRDYLVDDGDILFSWSGSLEVVIWGYGKGALNQHLFKVTSEKHPKWLFYYWIIHYLPEYRHIAEGKATTMGHIQRKHLKNSIVLVPDRVTLDRMDKTLSPIINKIINIKLESRNLVEIRDALLPKLMSGQIRVSIEVRT